MATAKTHWSTLADRLWDSDGCNPDAEQLAQAMREYRDHGCVSGFFFVDVSEDAPPYCDPWNNGEVREAWDCGPKVGEIDFAGLADQPQTPTGQEN